MNAPSRRECRSTYFEEYFRTSASGTTVGCVGASPACTLGCAAANAKSVPVANGDSNAASVFLNRGKFIGPPFLIGVTGSSNYRFRPRLRGSLIALVMPLTNPQHRPRRFRDAFSRQIRLRPFHYVALDHLIRERVPDLVDGDADVGRDAAQLTADRFD